MNKELIEKVRRTAKKKFEGSGVQYHNFEHTKEFVEAAKKICEGEEVSEQDREDVIIAGWLHDVGAVEGYEGHETRSAEKAEVILEDFDVSKERIEKIKDLIIHTDVPIEPENILHEIMLDADAAFVGMDDLLKKLKKMWHEFRGQGKFTGSKKEFFENSISLYKDLEYYTKTARKMFDEKREENLRRLKEKVKE